MNFFEETAYDLPEEWQRSLPELETFLQQNWSERKALYDDGNKKSEQCFVTFLRNNGIRTKNYVGAICFNGVQVNILPKVFKQTLNDTCTDGISDKFLFDNIVQWISYCDRDNFPYLDITSKYDEKPDSWLRELYITLYLLKVKCAIDRSFYFQYEEVSEENSPVIKGRFNVADYVLNKLPTGNAVHFACEYSEFQFDNKLNRIIKNVCRKLMNETKLANNKRRAQDILFKLDGVTDEQCTPYDCDRMHINRFHKHYENVLSLSKIFLMNESTDFSLGTAKSFCFLFPAEVLFEDYIAGMFHKLYDGKIKIQHSVPMFAETKFGNDSIENDLKARMDIVYEDGNKVLVLDTKYKIIPRLSDIKKFTAANISSSDLYQVLTYATLKNCKDVYLLYPLLRNEAMEKDRITCKINNGVKNDENDENGETGENDKNDKNGVRINIVKLPFVFDTDAKKASAQREQLEQIIRNIIGEPDKQGKMPTASY